MPDKHEVGGSSPLGPTKDFPWVLNVFKEIEYVQSLMKVKLKVERRNVH